MLLAAGRGKRLRPYTDDRPKALVEVRGEALIERHLRALAAAGIDEAVINLGWKGEQIVERIGSGEAFGVSVVYSDERAAVLETAGGVQKALPLLGGPAFLVINTDIYTDMPLPCPSPGDDELAHLVVVPKPAYRESGDFDLRDGRLVRSAEPGYTFAGIACYKPAFFAGLEPGRASLAPMMFSGAERGIVGGSCYRGVWEDVGTPERLEALNA